MISKLAAAADHQDVPIQRKLPGEHHVADDLSTAL